MKKNMEVISIVLCIVIVLGISGTFLGAYIRGGIDKYALPDGFDQAMQQIDNSKQDNEVRIMTSSQYVA